MGREEVRLRREQARQEARLEREQQREEARLEHERQMEARRAVTEREARGVLSERARFARRKSDPSPDREYPLSRQHRQIQSVGKHLDFADCRGRSLADGC
jgi:hypothetical protein